jgi:hypothetical protein
VRSREKKAARAELQAWYLGGLLPKLACAAKAGLVDVGALDALDADVRALLELSREQKEAA